MTTTTLPRRTFLDLQMSEFWSGDLGLTLVTISLVVLVFIITPLLRGRRSRPHVLRANRGISNGFRSSCHREEPRCKILADRFRSDDCSLPGCGAFPPYVSCRQI